MKRFSLLLLLGAWLCGCASQHEPLAIVPYPNHIERSRGSFDLAGQPFSCDAGCDEATRRMVGELAAQLSKISGKESALVSAEEVGASGVQFRVDTTLSAEGYRLEVTSKGVNVAASTFAGFLYAVQSLKQLLPAAIYGQNPAPQVAWVVPAVVIEDAPRFAYRGMHLDVSRHFFDVEEVKRYLDVMALHKLNTFHWHLTDDQGWRIEIKRYPRLTSVGSMRKGTVIQKEWDHYDNTPYGGFYTQDQIREVVRYAAERAITVIPEIDLPGHMLAALAAYPELGCTGGPYEVWSRWGVSEEVLCPGREETFAFLEGVLSEVIELFPSTYIHIGGDECPKVRWQSCPRCQARIAQLGLVDDDKHTAEHYLQSYVTDRIAQFLAAHGRQIIGWDELLEGKVDTSALIMSWRGSEGGITAAKLGHRVIMTPTTHCYFDYYQSHDKQAEPFGIGGYLPVEQVYSYDPAFPSELTPEQQHRIIGVQANLWTEYIADRAHLEYMLLPRLAALSEVQWTSPEQRSWERFIGTFRMAEIYQAMGYNYATHIYGVTGQFEVNPSKGSLEMTLTTQGDAPIYYTLDGTDPTANSERYTHPVSITQSTTFKATALREGISTSPFERSFLFSKSTCRPATLNSAPTLKYTYGGALSLVDGYHGGVGYTSGAWVGFLNEPLDLTIDMQGAGSYSSVCVESLVEKGEWVFPPASIEVYTSDREGGFNEVTKLDLPQETEQSEEGVKSFRVTFPESQARYLRVVVHPVSSIPAWHGAAGERAHLFVSEVSVE